MKVDNKQTIRELYKNVSREVKGSDGSFKDAVQGTNQQNAKISPRPDEKSPSIKGDYNQVLMETDHQSIERVVTTVAQSPDIREARVNAIAEQIKNGTYKVDPEAVAERILASGILNDNES